MRAKKALSGAVLALGVVVAPLFVGAGTAQAAPGSDLDLVTCSIVPDDTDWGDGIQWYFLKYTMKNEGSAPTGDFSYRVNGVYAKDRFSGEYEANASFEARQASLAPGQTKSGTFSVHEDTIERRTWGVFADVYHQTGESQTNDSFCSDYVNNT